jgi:nucleoside-diphosphate-sugar epimerase
MDTRTMKILVTGSSGFIARFLIPRLAAAGHTVVGIDKRTGPAFGDYFNFVRGDILDGGVVNSALPHVDLIIHLAAEHKDFGVPESLYYRVNVDGTEKLLQHASDQQIRRFIFYSSVAVYGCRPIPTNEMLEPAPDSHYGKSKLLAERRVDAWVAAAADRQGVTIRPTVVFGPHNYANMYRLIRSVAKRRHVGVGNGGNIKSISYVENVAAATLFLMDQMNAGVEIFNYADSPHMTTRDLVACIAKNLQVKLPSIRIPKSLAVACAFPFDVMAKVTKKDLPLTAKRIAKFTDPTHHEAEKIFGAGFTPLYSLEEGLQKTVEWYSAGQNMPTPDEFGSGAAWRAPSRR